jgi:Uma2 family endonuclease
MESPRDRSYTVEEYLAFELASPEKHEYLDGRILPMQGGTLRHTLIIGNMIGALHAQLRGRRCDVFSSQLLVRVDATGLHTHPDLSALCGEPELAGIRDEIEVLLNPSVLGEVLSPSTEAYDRGEKFWHYRQLPSLREYVLVSQTRMHVELFERAGASAPWMFSDASGPDGEIALPSIGAVLALRDVYERMDVPTTRPLRAVREPDAAYSA